MIMRGVFQRIVAVALLECAIPVTGGLWLQGHPASTEFSPTLEETALVANRDVAVMRRVDLPLNANRSAASRFAVRAAGRDLLLTVSVLQVRPGQEITIEVDASVTGRAHVVFVGDATRVKALEPGRWRWTAPDTSGSAAFRLEHPSLADTMHVNVLIGIPSSVLTGGMLDTYRIGTYLPRPARRSEVYEPPTSFVRVNPDDEDILISPHFTIGDVLCKQPGNPRYAVVSTRLVHNLEGLLAAVREAGFPALSLAVMSGYRTPAYNRAIGNTTSFSRHLYGDAADVYVDIDGDGQMDDLNGDGRSTVADARYLGDLMDRVVVGRRNGALPGGLATYRRNSAHGPFLHVDTRGLPTRW